ncbi:peptidylprolyl isomerase [Marinicella sediminis]|uniref:Peptidyl-prolyl cis-trans isomerase n=1 Tax=Marinicella sediminis TaxID=1792834 RepID=A0ABV7JG48_9GAMM
MNKIFVLAAMMLTSFSLMAQNTLVKMSTSEGDIYLKLYNDKAPLTVENFLSYVNEDFYNGTVFHRVISTFMIQGGGFTEDLERKPTKAPIQNEANNGLKNLRGTISMARLPDPHSATAQFFINVQDNAALNFTGEQNTQTWGYAVFGEVVKGMDVVDEIRFKPTAGRMPFRQDVPMQNVVIKSVEVIEQLPQAGATE